MSLPNSNWFFQTILKSFQSHVTNMLDRHPWLFVNFRHGLHRYSNSLTVFECAGDRQKDTMFSTQLHVLHAFCLLTVYSEPSYSPASARSESFVCRPCFSWCLFACHCTPSNQFGFLFWDPGACHSGLWPGSLLSFFSIRLVRIQPCMGGPGLDWSVKVFRNMFTGHWLMWAKIEKINHDETCDWDILLRLWCQTFLIFIVTGLDFKWISKS